MSYGPRTDRIRTRAGGLWHRMNTRCKVDGPFQQRNPTYAGASNEFKNFQIFADWCQDQFGYMEIDEKDQYWSLDKDLMTPGNKIYSPKMCCFAPSALNTLLLAHTSARGDSPLGVHWCNTKKIYIAQASFSGRQNFLGKFDNPHEAHRAWQRAKMFAFDEALEKYANLPNKILKGLRRHKRLIKADYKSNIETLR